ncbi:SDR family oxidoreductase [Zavarzinella formosa]|uniref:SDR family oxidoreductase n=1 Tax=Zavarzinella formosa TaxID=360055 RepID=UPI000495949E|nr:SDR family oxidoreductase [Zavarzinella formosa]
MDLQLQGKVAIITGASRGIGAAIAQTLAAEGVKLVLAARSRPHLEQVAASCSTESLVQDIDLQDAKAAETVVAAALSRFGTIDLLINNAGATKRGDFLRLSDNDWDDGFGLKFFGAMRLCRAAWPHLKASRGSIVNVAGIGGRTGSGDFTIGGSVNAALLNFTKALADRGVADGVRVNAVNPGSTLTERLQTRVRSLANEQSIDEAEAARRMAQSYRIARFATPEEVARVVAFLASPVADYCQGAIVDVDGGQTRTL